MSGRQVLVYYSWSRPGECGAPLATIEDRFPALFELRRMQYPRLTEFADPTRFDQGIGGFLDHIMKRNFAAFIEQATEQTGRRPIEIERVDDEGVERHLTPALLELCDTLIVIGFDSARTRQQATGAEAAAVRGFLSGKDHLACISPHHDIGDAPDLSGEALAMRRQAEFLHHGDKAIPPRQRFGGFACSLLEGLGLPVVNRFGLRPAAGPDGAPAPIEVETAQDRLRLLDGVTGFNLHPHLPHLERRGDAASALDLLARQKIDLAAPPHPFTEVGRTTFDALLQSRADIFAGTLLVGDTTLWSSTAGGTDNLKQLWTKLLKRPRRV